MRWFQIQGTLYSAEDMLHGVLINPELVPLEKMSEREQYKWSKIPFVIQKDDRWFVERFEPADLVEYFRITEHREGIEKTPFDTAEEAARYASRFLSLEAKVIPPSEVAPA